MIRKANVEDWESISSISARAGYDDYINMEFGRSYLDGHDVYVHISQEIDGFIKLEPLDDKSLWFSGLRVDPESRRKRIGTKLLKFALDHAINNGYKSLRCMVETNNIPSIRLMESFGLSVVDKYFFFSGGIDISDFEKSYSYSGNYANKEWKFDSAHETVYSQGNRQVYLHTGRMLYYTVLSGDEFKYTDEGSTCAPESIAPFIKLQPDYGFKSGYIFEMETSHRPDNL